MELKSKCLISYYGIHPEDYDIGFMHYNLDIEQESLEEYLNIEEDLANIKEYVGDGFFKIYISDVKDLKKLSENTNVLKDYASYLTIRVRNEKEYNEIKDIVDSCHLILPYEEIGNNNYLKESVFPITLDVDSISDLPSAMLDKLKEVYPIDSINLGQVCYATEGLRGYLDCVDEYFRVTEDSEEKDYGKIEKEVLLSNDVYSIEEYKLIEKKLHELVVDVTIYDTDYEKVEKIYNSIISTIHYDDEGLLNNSLNAQNLLGGLLDHTCVCEGYSKIFKQALSLVNIPSIIVFGGGNKSEGGHLWNQVLIDGTWRHIDATVGAEDYNNGKDTSIFLREEGVMVSDSLILKKAVKNKHEGR